MAIAVLRSAIGISCGSEDQHTPAEVIHHGEGNGLAIDDGRAETDERCAVPPARSADAAIGEDGVRSDRGCDRDGCEHRPRDADDEVALFEDEGAILEQEPEGCFEH